MTLIPTRHCPTCTKFCLRYGVSLSLTILLSYRHGLTTYWMVYLTHRLVSRRERQFIMKKIQIIPVVVLEDG